MYKILRADKDAYVTDKVIKSVRSHTSNVGQAGSLDLYKLYGVTTSSSLPNIELSRLLVHFDTTSLSTLISEGKLDVTDSSFECRLKLYDVYGGQSTPSNFYVNVHPLSRSFDEGIGRDIVFLTDKDVCNFYTSSRPSNLWIASGANGPGTELDSCDYFVSMSNGTSLLSMQLFSTGEENLDVDVTAALSATLAGVIPSAGFRVSFTQAIETDNRTYFVKRFASRQAYNTDKHPALVIKYDDSKSDDTQNLEFDTNNTLYLNNYSHDVATNILSASSYITGSNCLSLKLVLESSGTFTWTFSGSQSTNTAGYVSGAYESTINILSTDANVSRLLALSGTNTLKFTPIWQSLDGTVGYMTGSQIEITTANRTNNILRDDCIVNVLGVKSEYSSDLNVLFEVNIFNVRKPYSMIMRIPSEVPSDVYHDVYYSVRDALSNVTVIPFDTIKNSTRLSSDATTGMYFYLDMSSLTVGHQYVIDIMIYSRGNKYVYRDASPIFTVVT